MNVKRRARRPAKKERRAPRARGARAVGTIEAPGKLVIRAAKPRGHFFGEPEEIFAMPTTRRLGLAARF